MQAIAETGLQEILILTGESRSKSTVEYIGEACKIARKYFKVIGLEIYPVNSDEYTYLHQCGADYVTVFQETYNSDKYETLHLAGHKRIFPYRCLLYTSHAVRSNSGDRGSRIERSRCLRKIFSGRVSKAAAAKSGKIRR